MCNIQGGVRRRSARVAISPETAETIEFGDYPFRLCKSFFVVQCRNRVTTPGFCPVKWKNSFPETHSVADSLKKNAILVQNYRTDSKVPRVPCSKLFSKLSRIKMINFSMWQYCNQWTPWFSRRTRRSIVTKFMYFQTIDIKIFRR